MFTSTFIREYYNKLPKSDYRWVFEPKGIGPFDGYRYSLRFLPPERKFILFRMQIVPFRPVHDEELTTQFRMNLDDDEVAACMAQAMEPDPDDSIPF